MDYQKAYREKVTTAEEAVQEIHSGDWVDYGWATVSVDLLDRALAKRMPELTDVKIRSGMLMRHPAIFDIENAREHFTWNSYFITGQDRRYMKEGLAYYIPIRYSEVPRYVADHPVDVAMLQVAPMDKHGFFNFGPTSSHLLAVLHHAKKVIVEVNPAIPRCYGICEGIPISEVDRIVEAEPCAIPAFPEPGAPSEIDRRIATQIVEEIPDGACLQLGIGGMANSVGSLLGESDLKDLSVHSELYVDAFVDLTEKGKITGARKTVQPYKQVYTFAAGTPKLYEFLEENPACLSMPVNYVNDIDVIASIDNFISINNAVDFDLYGQVNAESSGFRHISGAGGQLDFVMGAYLSNGGKSFIACASTFKDKKGELHSRIRPTLATGSVVTDTRANPQYFATEYGMFNCKGASTWERAEGIIGLAHPDFREELIAEAEKRNIWRKSNKR